MGKVTPKGETELSPEERLLRAIFGEKAGGRAGQLPEGPPGHEGHRHRRHASSSRKEKDKKSKKADKDRIEELKPRSS